MGSFYPHLKVSLLALLAGSISSPSLAQTPARYFAKSSVPSYEKELAAENEQEQLEPFEDLAFATDSDLQQAVPVQFRSSRGGSGSGGRTSASPATLSNTTQRTPQSFAIRLARAPNMMGDFFGGGSIDLVAQGPSMTVSFDDFVGEVLYTPTGGEFGETPVEVLGGFAEFKVSGAFATGDATGLALRSVDPTISIPDGESFDLEIAAATGSGITDSDALERYQTAADAYLDTSGSDPQNALAAQQAAIIAQHGSGTFELADEEDGDTITFEDGLAEPTPVSTPSSPSNPVPVGGTSDPVPDSTGGVVPQDVNDGDPYEVSHQYRVTYADRLFTPHATTIHAPNPAAGDIAGRVRIQDNNSPLPRDRVFFDYNYFHNVPMTASGVDVNRFSPGFEKTFLNKMASIDVRVPMALTLDSTMLSDGVTDVSSSEFGNMGFISKFLLTSTETMAVAAGLGVTVPTADDTRLNMADGTEQLLVTNDSPHLLPYLGMLYTPRNSSCFVQAFLTCDFDTVGNEVQANLNTDTDPDLDGLQTIGTWQDQTLMTASMSFGSWCVDNRSPTAILQRLGWSAEIHYTSTISDSDVVSYTDALNQYSVGSAGRDLDILNGTIGLHALVGKTLFTTGYSVPLREDDKIFDGELRFFANRYF